jgi:uncharacterized membrane protein YeaQ/YmgE (transglycosylase-associated protein family)
VIRQELAGGFLGTLILTTMMRMASELGWTRMDFALILGTLVTRDRRKARALGYLLHFVIGLLFALVYGLLFAMLGRGSWWLGGLFGVVHTLFVSTVGVNILLPAVHPWMGTPETAANEVALIEPPGFLMLNYGRNTFLVALASHVAFGATVGWAFRM